MSEETDRINRTIYHLYDTLNDLQDQINLINDRLDKAEEEFLRVKERLPRFLRDILNA